jgi:two-component system sensor histidine kinase CpxA
MLPLWLQILGWFFLNLILLASVATLAFFGEFRPLLGAFLEGKAGHRLSALAGEVAEALNSRPRSDWPAVLDSFAEGYHVQVALFRQDGSWIAGEIVHPPSEVLEKFRDTAARQPHGTPVIPGLQPPPPPQSHRHFVVPSKGLYWIGIHIPPFSERSAGLRGPTTLLLASASPKAGGLLLESTSWWVAVAVLLASALFWLPLFRRLTVSLRTMRDAAESMAAGRFETRVSLSGSDELGSLAASLNHLASKLQDFVTGQKRFLGDIAHELCSPVARMEWSLGILEHQAGTELQPAVQDVREEVAQMSKLIEELLCFSRAGLQSETHPALISVAEIVQKAAHQEAIPAELLKTAVPDNLRVFADPHLLQRAVANVLRNALRYSGNSLPITVEARQAGPKTLISILDEGPGVPEDIIHRLCEPFFRPETARSRETGGTGLGLAIVQRAIETCLGSVSIRNRVPRGLCVEFQLPALPPPAE